VQKSLQSYYYHSAPSAACIWHSFYNYNLHFTVTVIVLAIGPKVRRFKPGQQRWILRAIKFRSTTSFGGKVKPSAQCCMTLRYVKDPLRYYRDIDKQISEVVSCPVYPRFGTRSICCDQSRELWWMKWEWLEHSRPENGRSCMGRFVRYRPLTVTCTFYYMVVRSTACVTLLRKAVDDIRIIISLYPSEQRK
jgi:hypothetical protein